MEHHKKLKEILDSLGLKYTFVAEKSCIPYSTFMHYLNGHKAMPEAKLRLVCLTFGIPLKKFGLTDHLSILEDSEKEAV